MKRLVVKLFISVVLAVLLLRLVYTTETGIAIVDALPDGLWKGYYALLGHTDIGDVERVQNADAALLLVLCLPLAAALVWALDLLLKKHASSGS